MQSFSDQRSVPSNKKSKAEDDIEEVEFDLLEPLRNSKWEPVISVIESAGRYGGFLAGGFAARLARISWSPVHPLSNPNNEPADVRSGLIAELLDIHTAPEKPCPAPDIDIFFDDRDSLECFVHAKPFSLRGARHRIPVPNIIDSAGGAAYEFRVKLGVRRFINNLEDKNVRFQLIKRWVGKPTSVIGDFDILNAMVGYRYDGGRHVSYVHKDWKTYEDQRSVRVLNWNSPMVIKRVAKYANRKGYLGLSPQTSQELSAAAITFIAGLRDGVYGDVPFCPTEQNCASHLSDLMPHLSIEQLIQLSVINTKFNSYDRDKTFHHRVMRTIHERHSKMLNGQYAVNS